uniref:Uncharacterized protein n=1 Tax=Triticum urartu TaxID=4572 RepID=A0A8R7P5U7_TRIUA
MKILNSWFGFLFCLFFLGDGSDDLQNSSSTDQNTGFLSGVDLYADYPAELSHLTLFKLLFIVLISGSFTSMLLFVFIYFCLYWRTKLP